MGVPKFYSWVRGRHYDDVIHHGIPTNVSTASFDLNGDVHPITGECFGNAESIPEERKRAIRSRGYEACKIETFFQLGQYLNFMLDLLRPRDGLILCLDSVVPRAKMVQKRARRHISALRADPQRIFDSNAITPGTQFMFDLEAFLHEWVDRNKSILPPKVVISSQADEGEGEHKIFDILNANFSESTGAHIIHGLDADLIMLATMDPLEKIFLMRHDVKERSGYALLNFDNFRKKLISESILINDFVLLFFHFGNDFLRGIPSLDMGNYSTVDTLIDVYKKLRKQYEGFSLTNETGIEWTNYAIFLKEMASEEHELLLDRFRKGSKLGFPTLQNNVKTGQKITGTVVETSHKLDFTGFRNEWYLKSYVAKHRPDIAIGEYHQVNRPTLYSQAYQLKNPGENVPFDDNFVAQMCIWYLAGIAWSYGYYLGTIKDVNTAYYYPYFYAPLFFDLANVASTIDPVNWVDYAIVQRTPIDSQLVDMLYVMPLASARAIPQQLWPLMTSPQSPILDIFFYDERVDKEGKDDEWAAVPLVPFADPSRIEQALSLLNLAPDFVSRYISRPRVCYTIAGGHGPRLDDARNLPKHGRREAFDQRGNGERGGRSGSESSSRGGFGGSGGRGRGGFGGMRGRGGGFTGRGIPSQSGSGSSQRGEMRQESDQSLPPSITEASEELI